jgi:hypothetical protein
MKKLIVMLGLALFACTAVGMVETASAQEKGFNGAVWTHVSGSMNRRHNDFNAMGIAIAPGWNFNRSLYVRLPIDATYGLWGRKSGVRHWDEDMTIGPMIGYNIIKSDSKWGILDVNASAGRSIIWNSDWNYMYYDMGVNWDVHAFDDYRVNEDDISRTLLGIGVRYYDSYNNRFGNGWNFYIKLGIRFN